MGEIMHRLRFVGGPSDGLAIVVRDGSFRERATLRLPSRPLVGRADGCYFHQRLRGYGSVYVLSTRCRMGVGGQATVHLEYHFTGFEIPDRGAIRRRTQPRLRPMTVLTSSLSRWRQKVGRWMLAPVDYPLKNQQTS